MSIYKVSVEGMYFSIDTYTENDCPFENKDYFHVRGMVVGNLQIRYQLHDIIHQIYRARIDFIVENYSNGKNVDWIKEKISTELSTINFVLDKFETEEILFFEFFQKALTEINDAIDARVRAISLNAVIGCEIEDFKYFLSRNEKFANSIRKIVSLVTKYFEGTLNKVDE